MKKRIVSICVASILVATLFSGCGKNTSTEVKNATKDVKNTITVAEETTTEEKIEYKNYYNDRFGFSFDYPSFFKQYGDLPTNGDGITMKHNNDMLTMSGSLQMDELNSGEKIKEQCESYGNKMTNTKVGKDSFYYESIDEEGNNTINFQQTCDKYGVNAGFVIIFDKDKTDYYRSIATDMIKSLKFKKGLDGLY
ncbi:MAG: hypothetical protein J6W35_03370 [Eubacterium sp.]|nr:hypothetical protein [Eubacterium sp.]